MIKDARRRIMLTKLNMTPMIDCVFLLILFFITVTELTRQDDIEAILLPDITQAKPDEDPDPGRLVINVMEDGRMLIAGTVCSKQEVEDALLVEARQTRNNEGISDRTVLVKADERTHFKHIRELIGLCVKQNIRIWRISFGIKPQDMSGGN